MPSRAGAGGMVQEPEAASRRPAVPNFQDRRIYFHLSLHASRLTIDDSRL